MLAIRNQESRAIMEWLRFQHFSMHGRWPTQSLPSAGWLSMPWWFPPCFSLVRLAQCSLSSAEHPVEGFLLSPSRREKKCGWVGWLYVGFKPCTSFRLMERKMPSRPMAHRKIRYGAKKADRISWMERTWDQASVAPLVYKGFTFTWRHTMNPTSRTKQADCKGW